jgi:hypothetical protein
MVLHVTSEHRKPGEAKISSTLAASAMRFTLQG